MYRVGLYCRVSVEEAGTKGAYSNSIQNQIQMGREYIARQADMILTAVYTDDGVSGSHFDRAAFGRLLSDIDCGKINMVLVKDISRLGREHIDTNTYLEKYFPEKGVRVVSLLEHYDSQHGICEERVELQAWMNDLYLRDTSAKVRAVIEMKRLQGEYTAKEPPYGYRKSVTIHNHLEIDPYAAGVVRRIYSLYLEGMGQNTIAGRLNEERICCPSVYKKESRGDGYPYPTGKGIWTKSAIGDILQNPVYTGAVVLRKTERLSYKLKEKRVIPPGERRLCEHAHPAIVTREQFEKVQEIREMRKIQKNPKSPKNQKGTCPAAPGHVYAGLLYCGNCGYAMGRRYPVSKKGGGCYVCGAHQEAGKWYCETNPIPSKSLDALVAFAVNGQLAAMTAMKRKPGSAEELPKERRELPKEVKKMWKNVEKEADRRMERIERHMEKNRADTQKLYEQYVDEVLSRDAYLSAKKWYEKEREQSVCEWKRIGEEKEKKRQRAEELLRLSGRWQEGEAVNICLSRELLEELIQRIYVRQSQIEIFFRFSDPYREGVCDVSNGSLLPSVKR